MDDEQEEHSGGSKISLPEGILMTLVIFCFDWVSGIPLIGPMLNLTTTQGYLYGKGMGGTYQLAMLGGNAITEFLSAFGLGAIPVDLVVFIGIFAFERLAPSGLTEKVEKAGEVVGKLEGQGAAGGAVAKTEGAATATKEAGTTTRQEAAAVEEGGAEKEVGRKRGGRDAGEETETGVEEEMSEEEAAKRAEEEKIEKQTRIGAEVPPEEEAEEEAFNPEETRFREAKMKTPGKE